MNKSKKMLILVILVIFIVALLGVTYAWFNYYQEGTNKKLVMGDIYMTYNEGNETLSLSNIFPETAEEARARNDNYLTFTVEGLNISNKDIYYEIKLNYGASQASPKERFNDKDLRFDLVELDSNGNEVTYLLSAATYESINDQRIWVETIDANTTSQVTKRYKLRMWLKENVVISDTALDKDYPTTGEGSYPNRYASVKVSVYGDLEEKEINKSLYDIMRETAVMDNTTSTFVSASTGIDFGAVSSDNNGKGVYIRAGTENDTYPIMYYRGAVEDNNVKFANKCWKAVRTTDTGGVKLIYNGELSDTYSGDAIARASYANVSTPVNAFTFDTTDNSWNITITDGSNPSISFNVPAGDNYSLVMTGTSGSSTGGTYYFYKNGSQVYSQGGGGGAAYSYTYSAGTLTASDVIKFSFFGSGTVASPITFKLIMQQNGSAISQSNYTIVGESFAFDETTQKWSSTVEPNKQATIGFNVSVAGDYFINFTNPNGGPFYIYRNGTVVSTASGTQKAKLFNLQTTDKIVVDYSQYNTTSNGEVEFYLTEAENVGLGCENTGTDTQITLNSTNTFAFSGTNLYKSPAYVGYMRGTNVYEYKQKNSSSTFKFGTGFTYSNGTYTLTSAENGMATTRHYTCFKTSETCDGTDLGKIYYVYYKSGNYYYYIELKNGKSVEDALAEMQTNTVNSNAKENIEDWYEANMTSYTSKIEDTIYCNDRSMNTQTNGWIANGGGLTEYSYFAPFGRAYTTYSPSLSCTNKNDSFTWKNGNGNQKLEYPVGMLTSDEIILAGETGGSSNGEFYLNTRVSWWSLSPYSFNDYRASEFVVNGDGFLYGNYVNGSNGLRPVVSLKPGTPVVSGSGTVADPYVIE